MSCMQLLRSVRWLSQRQRDRETERQRDRDVGNIGGKIDDDLAVEEWTQSEPTIGFVVFQD